MSDTPDRATRAYTGRNRQRKTRFSIRAADCVSQIVINIGGLGTIVAVLGVFVYLAAVTLPLFESAQATPIELKRSPWNDTAPRHFEVDEFQSIGWALADNGALAVFRADNGALLDTRSVVDKGTITSAFFASEEDMAVLGFEDGSIRFGRIGFGTRFFEPEDMPDAIRSLQSGGSAPFEGGMAQRTPQAQFRVQEVQHTFDRPISTGGSAVNLLAYTEGAGNPRLAYYTQDGRLILATITEKRNLLTGQTARVFGKTYDIPYENAFANSSGEQPTHLALSARGDAIYLAWADGRLERFDARRLDRIVMVEQVDLVADPDAELTALKMLLGGTTLIAGDSQGRLAAWFPAREVDGGTGDGFQLYKAHVFPQAPAAVTALSMSARTRTFAAGFADGHLGVFHVTSEQQILDVHVGQEESVWGVFLAPKEDGLYAGTAAALLRWNFDPRHPEASVASLFRKVWYEGYAAPAHQWQSSGGSEDLEPKLGLVPLIFGSMKATLYAMLFGAPLALLAAIYTSEFLPPRTKARIKPMIEIMASLPSVVLGFLAGLVIAPFVEKVVPTVLCVFFTVPFTILLGSYLWQMLPHHISLRLSRSRLCFIVLSVPCGLAAAWLLGPLVETAVFAGDIKSWLDGQAGTGFGGWLIMTVPLSALIVAVTSVRGLNRWIRNACSSWTRAQFVRIDLVKFLALTALTLFVSASLAGLLTLIGLDPRGTYVDTYEQRNALVVGFAMGFAIIPIIYTIAEDALSSVPDHLRSASLGCGATPWQTAITIVVPTAMSGLFSALMVGLGRAVGETMIVLMAAGNTPVTDWNIFNGFRTLSANIAVELPEAVQQSTHYRTLFLAALTLFLLTFLVNTLAELVRIRFRKRVVQI
jgi:phosphate transport system permease protein